MFKMRCNAATHTKKQSESGEINESLNFKFAHILIELFVVSFAFSGR